MKVTINIIVVCVITVTVAEKSFSNVTCGVDNSETNVVCEGSARVDTYPWLGYLVYPLGKRRLTTVVVLVTKQIVLGTATEIDNLPKDDFREQARVVLGHSCRGDQLRVRDYIFHPEYGTNSISALAMVQLNLDGVKHDSLRPICPPPAHFMDPEFYAMTLSHDCNKPEMKLYKMKFVEPSACKTYYRKSGLDIDSIWPTHTACARAKRGGECLWQSGTALVLRQGKRWNLVGFGIYGPGCQAPARFLDYGMYHEWVRQSVLRIGRPTITRVGDNEVILRRSLSNLQRFGMCDEEEKKLQLYADHTKVTPTQIGLRKVRYNMTIYASIEYSCVLFRANNFNQGTKPKLRLRRWCAGTVDICSEHQTLEIDFYVEIIFSGPMTYDLIAYGRVAKAIDTRRALAYINQNANIEPIPRLHQIQEMVKKQSPMPWYSGPGSNDDLALLKESMKSFYDDYVEASGSGEDSDGDLFNTTVT